MEIIKNNPEEILNKISQEESYYQILKAELETPKFNAYIKDNLKNQEGYFVEVYNDRIIKLLSIITYIKKDPENYKEAWERWAEEQNEIIKREKKDNKENKINVSKNEEEEKQELRIIEEKKYQKIKLSDLNASLINNYVSVDCQITGEQIQKAIPENIEIYCETCGRKKIYNSLENPEPFISDREIKTILQELKNKFMCACVFAEVKEGEAKPKPYKTAEIKSYIDYSVLFVRDLLDRESLIAVKRYESKRVYVINQILPNAKKINIKGKVFIEPKTKNISIICDTIQQLENQVEDFKITEEFKENSKKYFNSGENIYKQINPDIVGKAREIAKQSLILQLHSPCKIYDITRKKLIRGGLNIIFYGDTKCGKSDIAKDITQKGSMPVGEYTICETGGRTGFLYTIDTDKGSLIWGSLALNDMGLVVFDGLQSMHSEELGEFREAIEGQEIIVRRSISGDALARTRILGSLNPNKPMINYIYKCQGLQDTYVFSKSPEFTRWDLFIPFSQRDVSGKEIAHRQSEEKPIPEDIFINHIYWVWSRKPEQIIYTESAVKKINDLSEEFIENYSLETLPIVHNGVRDIITRLSVAMACRMHSTDETNEKVIVETEHIEKSTNWYKEVLDMLELAKYKQDTEGKSELTDNDCIAITKELGETEWQILEEIKHEQRTSTQLSATLDKSADTIKEHYKLLKKHNLIETKTGQGISLSIRGVRFVRWGMLSAGGLGEKTTPIKNDGGKITHYPTSKKEGHPILNFEPLEDIKDLLILKEGKPESLNLEKGKKYNISILGDNFKEIFEILLNDNKIKLQEETKKDDKTTKI